MNTYSMFEFQSKPLQAHYQKCDLSRGEEEPERNRDSFRLSASSSTPPHSNFAQKDATENGAKGFQLFATTDPTLREVFFETELHWFTNV